MVELLKTDDDGLVAVELSTNWEGWTAGSKLRVDPVRAAAMYEEGVLAGKNRVKPVIQEAPPPAPRVERRKRPAPAKAAPPLTPEVVE